MLILAPWQVSAIPRPQLQELGLLSSLDRLLTAEAVETGVTHFTDIFSNYNPANFKNFIPATSPSVVDASLHRPHVGIGTAKWKVKAMGGGNTLAPLKFKLDTNIRTRGDAGSRQLNQEQILLKPSRSTSDNGEGTFAAANARENVLYFHPESLSNRSVR